jgi:hypothetical protein
MKTNQVHYLSLIYFIKQPVHVSGMFDAHYQEVFSNCWEFHPELASSQST